MVHCNSAEWISRAMQSQFREMDRMMNAMLDPFGMMMGGMGMIEVCGVLSLSR